MAFSITVRLRGQEQEGRLDRVLASLLGNMGLRGVQRIFKTHAVFLNGRKARKGDAARAGDLLVLFPLAAVSASEAADDKPIFLGRHGSLVAFAKPPFLHTAHIAGSLRPSMEGMLDCLLSGLTVAGICAEQIRLLTRLDYETSGLVFGALDAQAEAEFRLLERRGAVCKEYLALVQGEMKTPMRIENRLETANRAKTAVLPERDEDMTRHTRITPLCMAENGRTLVRAVIGRGARHQIRAHLAFSGYPLAGDVLYGVKGVETAGSGGFFLHCWRARIGDFSISCRPDGRNPFVTAWLQQNPTMAGEGEGVETGMPQEAALRMGGVASRD